MRKRGRIDGNQVAIVRALRQMGYSVLSISDIGNGAPDLVIGAAGKNYLVELKDWTQPVSKRKLTLDEKAFHLGWQGQISVAETIEDIWEIMEAHQ